MMRGAWRTLSMHSHSCDIVSSSEMYANEDGTIPATFQVLYFIGKKTLLASRCFREHSPWNSVSRTGWKPDPSQPKPIKRGSGQVSLKDLDNLKAK